MVDAEQADNPRMPDVSVVIPMYNEEDRIGVTLADAIAYLRERDETSEIVLVDDGSTDGTRRVVAPYVSDSATGAVMRVRIVSYGENRGKGAAVNAGLAAALGATVLMMDADNAATVREIEKLSPSMGPGVGIVAGSREADGADVEAVLGRKITGGIFRAALAVLGLGVIRDTQCGFKLYSRRAVEVLVANAKEPGFVFDLEHLAIVRKAGLKVVERGIRWRHVDGSKVSPIRDGLKMLARAARLRARLAQTPLRDADAARVVVEAKPAPAALQGSAG